MNAFEGSVAGLAAGWADVLDAEAFEPTPELTDVSELCIGEVIEVQPEISALAITRQMKIGP